MKYIRYILFAPFAAIYGFIMWIRSLLYRSQFIGSTHFDIPVISVGNLSVGGTGKTPFVELLIELLQPIYNVAVLSRGYKRKTTGFLEVATHHTVEDVGDEPLMIKLKYPNILVSVGEERVIAIPKLLNEEPDTEIIILDDAFQHQSVRPDINILLTTYDNPYYNDFILPMGTLREPVSGKERANIIVVTKCPENLSEEEATKIRKKLKVKENQKVFFSTISYGAPYPLYTQGLTFGLMEEESYVLLTGIANADSIKQYITPKVNELVHYEFEDHHYFKLKDLLTIKNNYPYIKHWVTTEKDAIRLKEYAEWFDDHDIKLFCLPIKTKLILQNAHDFETFLKGYLEFYFI